MALHALASPKLPQRLPREAGRQERLESALDREIPNWREFDRDPRWHAWLCGTHLYSELSRGWHLDNAAARGDANSVIGFYRDFLAWRPRRTPPPAGPPPDGKRIYSRPEILELHAQHRKGAYAGREIEWMRIENDIIAAGREGRVIGSIPVKRP